jgi:hypothetical protein
MKTVRIFMTAQKILFHALRTSVFATELTHDLSAKNRSIMIGTDTAYFFFDFLDFGNGRLAGFLGFDGRSEFGGHDWMLSAL